MNTTVTHIVGGRGSMGMWLKRFLESKKIEVSISGRSEKNEKGISRADIIFISVPNSTAPHVIDEISKLAKQDTLIVDLSSIKSNVIKSLKKTSQPSIAMHFMFGPKIATFKNQLVVFIPIGKSKHINFLKDLIAQDGGQIVAMDAESHDRQTAITQALTHFVNIVFAQTLVKNSSNLKSLLTTPVFLSQYSTMSRVLLQDSQLLSELQTENPFAKEKLALFVSNAIQLQKIASEGNTSRLGKDIEKIQKEFSPKREEGQIVETKKTTKAVMLPNFIAKIGYLGPEGTYTSIVAKKISNTKYHKLLPIQSIFQIFLAVENREIDFGIVPAENSTEGTVRETLDWLLDFDVTVLAQVELPIVHNLLSFSHDIKKINTIISHPQANAQCGKWIKENIPNAKIISAQSTVSEIEGNRGSENIGFIGSSEVAKNLNLNILAKNIQDRSDNVTRFYIISKKTEKLEFYAKRTLLFVSVFNRVGILRDILNVIASYDINLTKLESRPSREKAWDYGFFLELDVEVEDQKFSELLNVLREYCTQIKILGKV